MSQIALESTILQLVKPDLKKLEVDELTVLNVEGDVNSTDTGTNIENINKQYPFVQIHKEIVDIGSILYFKLDCSSFIPVLKLTIDSYKFSGLIFPADGDLVKIRIGAINEKSFKSIRLNFNILSIRKIGSFLNLDCILHIPGYTGEASYCWENTSTFDTFLELSEIYGLGFCTNEIETYDQMNRCFFRKDLETFIQDETLHSFKTEIDFYTSFIDFYYNLNFVNVNNQLSARSGIDISQIGILPTQFPKNYKTDDIEGDIPLVLSNHKELSNTNMYISNWSEWNNAGEIFYKTGYSKTAEFWDSELWEPQKHKVESISTPGVENIKNIQRGRVGSDTYKKWGKSKWLGKQDNFNTHPNYQYAAIWNSQNLQDSEKSGLILTLSKPNHHLYKYQVIPVMIYEYERDKIDVLDQRDAVIENSQTIKDFNNTEEENQIPVMINKTVSDYYVIRSISYIYTSGGEMTQELVVIRREVPPTKIKDIN
jgi:hypothetical protein